MNNKQVRGSLTNHRGKWRIVITYYDDNDVRRQKTFSTGLSSNGNKRKAEQILKQKLDEFEKTLPYMREDTSELTLSAWVEETLEKVSKEVRDTTMVTYVQNYNAYIKDYFGNILLRDITPKTMDKYYKILSQRLGTCTMKTTTAILNRAFKEAVVLEMIPSNPLASIIKAKGTTDHKQTKKIYTADEAKEMLCKLKGEVLYPIIYTTLTYGLRRGEVLGLSWDDIDFENRTIQIRKTVVNVNSETLVKEYCKTKSSVRVCTMTDEIYELLKEQKENQEKYKLLYKNKYIYNDYDFVFCCRNGKMRSPRGLTASYKYVLAKHGIEESRIHDLRHTTATLMFENGADASTVQHALGHSQIGTTMNIYVHNTDTTNSKAANIMGQLLK